MLSYDELTSPERELWDAFPEGRRVDLRTGVPEDDRVDGGGQWGPGRTVRATVIVALLLGTNTARPGAVACLRLAGARISGHFNLAGAQVAHALWLEDCWVEEGVDLSGASTQSIAIVGSRVPGVEAGMIRIDGRLDLRRSRLESGSASPFHRRVTALSLINATVSGAVNLNGAEITAPEEWAVSAGGLVAEGGVYCADGFIAHGEVRLMGAQLPGGLHMRGALLERPGRRGVALALDNAVASTLDFSDGFTANGTVRLRGARISDNLTFEGAVLNGPPDGHGPSLTALLMQAVDFDFTLARQPSGTVDLRGAQVSYVHDSEQSWPDVVELEGFVYGSIKKVESGERREAVGRWDSVARRVAWIRRSSGYSPQPYEQLASWYRTIGHDDDARRVLLAKQRHRRCTLSLPTRTWGHLLDVTVGYGYRPWLAGVWLLALTLLGTLVFGAHSPTPVKQGEGAPFQPLVYTLDLLIPIGGLGQRTAWYWTDGSLQWLAYLLIALGWVLTTAVIAGVTRTVQRN
ncbi:MULTISPECIES: oxidoreductase [unclassified Streptomyces]|uniref:oxidoreductase n=1 Tax=unclassified Streptomyces TaxID=2593676 RepID=UPI002E8059A2|nr:oxidoreductase [Streptomyces sp. NBC_00589]WTI33674.1 oxidoreductase [Streptomyces sp. NBC_00775]WUB32654.1 oxidoreductase [Streptomyces sp. NBC_00589]